jgi:4-hydroxythreonine-4-phosphate dehydrogenase
MNDNLVKIGITQGDINGIGYELILKTLEDVRIFEFCIPVIYGSSKILAYHRKALDIPSVNLNMINSAQDASINRFNLINCGNDELVVEFSRQTQEGEAAAKASVQRAIVDLNAGKIQALVTTPVLEDYTPLIELEAGKGKHALRIFIKDNFRIALATNKVSFSEISALLTVDMLVDKIKLLHNSLVHDFVLTAPRIAVLSLNPKAERKENWGKEENEIIIPALEIVADAGICCIGPYSASKLFGSEEYRKFDAILAMYYEQALIPFRTITCGEGVGYMAGLPVIITSPDQDVSYEIAGKNMASESAFRNALYLSFDLFRNRIYDKEIYANPLRKQYFERGSDNEKLDLTKDE